MDLLGHRMYTFSIFLNISKCSLNWGSNSPSSVPQQRVRMSFPPMNYPSSTCYQTGKKSSLSAVLICTSWAAKCVCWHSDCFLCKLTAHVFCPFSFIHWVLCLFSWIYRHSLRILDSNCLSELLKYLLPCHLSFNICLWFLLLLSNLAIFSFMA